MKQVFILFLLSATVCFSGCKKKITQFYVDYNSSVVISSTVGSFVPFSLNTPEVETNSSFVFENNDTDADRVKSVYLKNLDLTITSPNSETFSFLNSIELFIKSPSYDEKRIAFETSIPNSAGNKISLKLDNIDLKEFIKESKFELRVRIVTDETIPQDVYVNIYSNFLVQAQLIRSKS